MVRRFCARYLLSVVILLAVAIPLAGPASARLTSDAAAAPIAATGAPSGIAVADAPPDVGGPRPRFGYTSSVLAQATPNVPVGLAGLQQLANIGVSGWSATNPPSFDVQSFDPVQNIMYVAARNPAGPTIGNSGPGLLAIDTTTNTLRGILPVPDCDAVNAQRGSFACPSGSQVMPELRKVAVTSRGDAGQSWVEIFDIAASPTAAPLLSKITLPNNQGQSDELDWDPVNRRLYVSNTGGALFVAVIDGVTNQLLGQIPVAPFGCTATEEQTRFDPADGFIYQPCASDSLLLRIDPNAGAFGAVVSVWRTPCASNGIDVNPETNQALIGCNPGPQAVVDLNAPNTLATPPVPIPVVATFPQDTASDGLRFNNNTLRWYSGSSGNTNLGVPCPASQVNPAQLPVLGVFQAGLSAATTPSIVGVQCTANGAHTVGIDPIRDQVYVPAGIPVNAIMVFKDNTPGQAGGASSATLGNNGSVSFTPNGTGASVLATLTNLNGGTNVWLVVVTTVGNEVVNCTLVLTGGTCQGTLVGTPIAGAPVLLARNGAILARGTVVGGAAPPLTTAQALGQVQAQITGVNTNRPCGTPCTGANNGLNVTGTQTGSFTWTVSATLPPAPAAGLGGPVFVTPTTAFPAGEAVFCTGGPAAGRVPGTVFTCTARTTGNPFLGAPAFLVFPAVGAAVGPVVGPAILTGPGVPAAAAVAPAAAVGLPLLPPFPPLLPPPPPLLPPPPSVMGAGQMRMPEVPVIPEADSLPLLLGGLAALGALAGWRARRRQQ